MASVEPKRWNVEAAVGVGFIWVNGVAMAGGSLPFAALALLLPNKTQFSILDAMGIWAVILVPVVMGGVFLVFSWLAWSSQITVWRLWAYRRVDDVAALKAAATGSLIWPDGHLFERTEFRSRDQVEELYRLEAASALRMAARLSTDGKAAEPRSLLGTVLKAAFWGFILAFMCVLMPASLLQMVGVDLSAGAAPWLLLAVFVAIATGGTVAVCVVAFGRHISADAAMRQLAPKWVLRKEIDE